MKKVVYTSLEDFIPKSGTAKSFFELGEEFSDWVVENSIKLLSKRNKAELMAGEELKKYISVVHEQVFFRISGCCYFLDYYIPKYRLAIEIDGSYHKTRRIEDKQRDNHFKHIGIKTIRIKAKDVLKGNFIIKLREKLTTNKKHSKKYGYRRTNRKCGSSH